MVAIIVVPDSLKADAEKCVSLLSPSSVGEALTIPLTPIDQLGGPPTHWAATPNISGEALKLIRGLMNSKLFAGCVCETCDPDECLPTFLRTIETLGLTRSAEQELA